MQLEKEQEKARGDKSLVLLTIIQEKNINFQVEVKATIDHNYLNISKILSQKEFTRLSLK